jgi:outer membrane receptor protein involved in Fe transport
MSVLKVLIRGSDPAGGPAGFGRTISHSLLLTLSIAISSLCVAQDVVSPTEADVADEVIEEIVVTGSRIKRRDFNTPSPLTTISSEDIDFSGQATIEETLNQMPQVMPSFNRASNGSGSANVDLRGLGLGRTLVLLNGRRIAPSGLDNAVDLNNIPQFLIERVEIITGGTSAVYGSDAIAGVVNVITREDYTGFGVEAGVTMAEQGDAATYDFNISYGHDFADGRGNVAIYANIFERQSLLATDRESTGVQYYDDWEGNLIEIGSWRTPAGVIAFPPADLGNGPVNVTFNPDGTPRAYIEPDDEYNFVELTYLQVPLNRLAFGVMGHYGLSERFEAYLEANFIRNEASISRPPSIAQLAAVINLDNPVLTPEAQQVFADNYTCGPNLACVVLGRRLTELGPRLGELAQDYARIVAGFRGDLWKSWEFDGWVTYTTESARTYARNDASRSRFQQGLLVDPATNECFDPSGGCVPLNIFGEGNLSAEGVAFIRFQDFENVTERTHKLASVFVTGSPVDTWAGSLDMALGLEWRSDETYFKGDDALDSGDAFSWRQVTTVSGTEEVFEVYAEAVVPLATERAWARYLGIEVGGRYSEYKHAGGVSTYKAGGEWQPFESLRFRAMHQRSVRAPTTDHLFSEQTTRTTALYRDDPCSASANPVDNGNVEKCILQGLPADQIGVFEQSPLYPLDLVSGGNPNLVPEVAETWTVGAVISPEFLSDWVFTVDYYLLDVEDTIGGINAMDICFDPVNTGNLFCQNIARDLSGNIGQITELISNRGLLNRSGIDTQIQYAADLPGFLAFRDQPATISVNLYWTYMLTHKEQESPVSEVLECAGYFGWPCDSYFGGTLSRNRVTSNIHYASGPLGLHLTWRWIEGTDNAAPFRSEIYGVPDPDLAVPTVGDKNYLDLGLVYEFSDHFTTRFGVNNLLDTSPPQMADTVFANNTDTGLYDVFGRSYYLTMSAHF